MDRNQRRSRKLTFSILGTALALPLLVAPASAGISDGRFLVHAANVDSGHEAYAGLRGDGSPAGSGSDGGGGTTPGAPGSGSGSTTPGGGSEGGTGTGGGDSTPGGGSDGSTDPGIPSDSSSILASYSCGPLSVDVTQDMVNFSKANEDAAESDGSLKAAQGGWQSLSTFSFANMGMALGVPEDGSKSPLIYLSKGMALPAVLQTDDNTVLMSYEDENSCQFADFRETPKAGVVTNYSFSQYAGDEGKNLSETRYLSEEGKLNLVQSGSTPSGTLAVYRSNTSNSTDVVVSDTKPYRLLPAQGEYGTTLEVMLRTHVGEYNNVHMVQNVDGSEEIFYRRFTGVTDGQLNFGGDAPNTPGPTNIGIDPQGNIVSMHNNKTFLNGESLTKNDWNVKTGQDWNGFYHRISDFDTRVPFAPTSER